MRINLFPDAEGEPRIWSHGINESARAQSGSWPLHYRWFLHSRNWCFIIEWAFKKTATPKLLLHIGEGDAPEIGIWFGIPFLLSLYLTLEWSRLKRFVPTVRTKSHLRKGEYWDMPVTRRIGFRIFGGRIWFDLWADDHNSSHNKSWQQFNLNLFPTHLLFGRAIYSKFNEQRHETEIIMPEGRYPATVTTFISCYKRPRWPFSQRIPRAEIEIPYGIPIPGKGDNGWDMGDDAIDSITISDATIRNVQQKVFDCIMRERIRHAAADWRPTSGWPAHCLLAGNNNPSSSSALDTDELRRQAEALADEVEKYLRQT